MSKFLVKYENGKYDYFENITAEEVIAKCKHDKSKAVLVVDEIYIHGKYIGEVNYSFEEFCKLYGGEEIQMPNEYEFTESEYNKMYKLYQNGSLPASEWGAYCLEMLMHLMKLNEKVLYNLKEEVHD